MLKVFHIFSMLFLRQSAYFASVQGMVGRDYDNHVTPTINRRTFRQNWVYVKN